MPSNEKRRRRFRRELVFLLVLLAVTGFGIRYYLSFRASEGKVRAVFVRSDGSQSSTFRFLVADTPDERERGLMYRKPGFLDRNEGMIFVFPDEARRTFWMRNTYISLDMIFVDRNFRVVGVVNRVPILNEVPRGVGQPSTYVVEVLAGMAEEQGIREGVTLKLLDPLPASS